jgi:3-oxosteroid 1-dehydrogenase
MASDSSDVIPERPGDLTIGDGECFDFICVGGGLGGLAAAVRAASAGLRVLGVEKSPLLGGVAAYSGGSVWAPGNHFAREAGLIDSLDAADEYASYVGGRGLPYNVELRAAFLEAVGPAIEFFTRETGIGFGLCRLPEQYFPQAAGSTVDTRHLEVGVDGIRLGNWQSLLREAPYVPPHVLINELTAAAAAGVPVEQFLGAEGMADRRARNVLTRGRGLTGDFLRAAVELGVSIVVSAPVRELVVENERVVGVQVEVAGSVISVRAERGVLLATGSYGNADWAASMEGLPELFEQAPPVLDGDGITLAESTRAAVVRAGNTFCTLGYRAATAKHPGTDEPLYYPILDSLGFPHIISVNAAGERYGDESFYGTFVSSITEFDGRTKQFPNLPSFVIMDNQFRTRGYHLGWSGAWPEQELTCAATVAELALALGIDGDGLARTLSVFNDSVDAGADLEFGRGTLPISRAYGDSTYPNPNLGRLDEGPYWGARLHLLTAGIYSHGLTIDSDARVLSRKGDPVPGLYATGNLVAHAEMPFGYENGFANSRNLTYGYLAATHATGSPLDR